MREHLGGARNPWSNPGGRRLLVSRDQGSRGQMWDTNCQDEFRRILSKQTSFWGPKGAKFKKVSTHQTLRLLRLRDFTKITQKS